jgi:hypothetical protein
MIQAMVCSSVPMSDELPPQLQRADTDATGGVLVDARLDDLDALALAQGQMPDLGMGRDVESEVGEQRCHLAFRGAEVDERLAERQMRWNVGAVESDRALIQHLRRRLT